MYFGLAFYSGDVLFLAVAATKLNFMWQMPTLMCAFINGCCELFEGWASRGLSGGLEGTKSALIELRRVYGNCNTNRGGNSNSNSNGDGIGIGIGNGHVNLMKYGLQKCLAQATPQNASNVLLASKSPASFEIPGITCSSNEQTSICKKRIQPSQ